MLAAVEGRAQASVLTQNPCADPISQRRAVWEIDICQALAKICQQISDNKVIHPTCQLQYPSMLTVELQRQMYSSPSNAQQHYRCKHCHNLLASLPAASLRVIDAHKQI